MPTYLFRRGARSLALLALVTAWAGSAFAVFPEKAVRMVVPFAPGGGTDLIARTLGHEMAKDLGQPVIIDNKPGAGTLIGTDNVAKSAPDGYSIVVASFAHAINPTLQPKLPYGSNKAFAPVILVGRGPNVLVVRPDSPFKSVADILAAAKANPEKFTFASQGAGTSAHLAGEMFANLGNVKLTHIPYRGAGPALTDLLGGQVDMMFATAAAVASFIDGGKLRPLGVTTAEPSPAFKGIAPIGTSVPGYVVDSWYGLYVPAGTPAAVIERLNAAARKAARAPDFVRKIEHEGLSLTLAPQPNWMPTCKPKSSAGHASSSKTTSSQTEQAWDDSTLGEIHGLRPDSATGYRRCSNHHTQPAGQAQRDERRHARRVHRRAGTCGCGQRYQSPGAHWGRQGVLCWRRHQWHAKADERTCWRGGVQWLAPTVACSSHASAFAHNAQTSGCSGERSCIRFGSRHGIGLRFHHCQ